jgi:hypothetical protein
MNMRDFWANEAAAMRDTSGVLGKEVLKPVENSEKKKIDKINLIDGFASGGIFWVKNTLEDVSKINKYKNDLEDGVDIIKLTTTYPYGLQSEITQKNQKALSFVTYLNWMLKTNLGKELFTKYVNSTTDAVYILLIPKGGKYGETYTNVVLKREQEFITTFTSSVTQLDVNRIVLPGNSPMNGIVVSNHKVAKRRVHLINLFEKAISNGELRHSFSKEQKGQLGGESLYHEWRFHIDWDPTDDILYLSDKHDGVNPETLKDYNNPFNEHAYANDLDIRGSGLEIYKQNLEKYILPRFDANTTAFINLFKDKQSLTNDDAVKKTSALRKNIESQGMYSFLEQLGRAGGKI